MTEDIINAFVGRERNCHICGKEFLINPDWVYKHGSGNTLRWFCSWKCLRSYESKQMTKAEKHEAMQRMLEAGKSIKEVAETLNVDSRSVYYWKHKLEKGGLL